MTQKEKNQIIDSLKEQLNTSDYFYFTDIAGLNSEATISLRRLCFKKDVKLQVVKNTLLQKAMKQAEKNLEAFYGILQGPTSIMWSKSGNLPAQIIKEFRKTKRIDKPILKGAYVEEMSYVGEDQLDILVNIKSKNELIGDIIGLLQSPVKNLLSALQSGGQIITGVIKTLSEKESK